MKGTYLRFYVHELRRRHGEPLYDWLLKKAKDIGIHGGSAFRAIAGYGRHGVLHEQRFFELPKSIAPPALPFHAPDLRLRISLGDRTHLVQLYAPDSLSSNPEAARFLAVWKAVFALVPMQPTWKARG